MNSYPLFFKIKVVVYHLQKSSSVKQTLDIFGISKSSLYNWIKQYNEEILAEKKKYKKTSKYTGEMRIYIKKYVTSRKIFNYKKLITLVNKKFKIKICKTAIYDILKNMNISRKRMKRVMVPKNMERLEEQRKNFRETIVETNLDDVICIDETSIDTRMIPAYAWSVIGKKVYHSVNATKERFSVVCAISNKKVIHYEIVKGSIDAVAFKNFMECLYESCVENKKIIVDNARIHHALMVNEYMETTTNEFIFNAPYTPEYNPIEKVFGKLKRNICKTLDTSRTNLFKIVKNTFKNIPANELQNYYRSSLTF